MARGRFIVADGLDGAGKSTQVRLLASALRATGSECVMTREPGGTPGADALRHLLVDPAWSHVWLPWTEALLHFAARNEHLAKRIAPALEHGGHVVCDRFADSTIVYQGIVAGAGRERVEELRRLVLGDVAPDLTIILDLPAETARARVQARRGDDATRYDLAPLSFYEQVRAGFLELAGTAGEGAYAVIDATAEPAAVHAAIIALLNDRLALGLAPVMG